MKRSGQLGLTALAALAITACGGGGSYWAQADYHYPIAIDDTARAVVMPANLHVPGGSSPEVNLAFMGGVAAACGDACLPAQPLLPVLEQMGINNLSWLLAEGMYHAASVHGGETWDHDYTEIPDALSHLFEAINSAFPDANIRYIVVGHVDEMGAGMVPETVNMRVLGGLYDIQEHRIATVFWYEETMPAASVAANVGLMGARIVQLATCPMGDDGCHDTQAALGIEELHTVRF